MRGEHPVETSVPRPAQGSSPHARGARASSSYSTGKKGIIPACAGSTRGWIPPRGRGRDHPRMRGEHPCLAAFEPRPPGSSPHARGALRKGVKQMQINGIIPACAGSTNGLPRRRGDHGDHPRMRGEHHGTDGLHGRVSGIIPACAGSTALLSLVIAAGQDHPRMRGEHLSEPKTPGSVVGSSPHARGAHPLRHGLLLAPGIIPACAGSTTNVIAAGHCTKDHPRMRGEHFASRSPACHAVGSSPHARGALVVRNLELALDGIIPACAGSTLHRVDANLSHQDHPRMRGEHPWLSPGQ